MRHLLGFIFFAGLTLIFPIWQLLSRAGVVFYQNGLDEGSYLQYDFAKIAAAQYWRPSQYLVILLHEFGLSGGQINLLFDVVALTLFPWLVFKIFEQLGFSQRVAFAQAIVVSYLPLLFVTFNPIFAEIFDLVISSGAIFWITTSHTEHIPLTRSPEPQLSLILMAAATLFTLQRKDARWLLLPTPFLYSFLAPAWLFIGLAAVAYQKFVFSPVRAIIGAGVAVSALLAVYFHFLVGAEAKNMLVNSRLPLIPVSVIVAIVLSYLLRRRIPAKFSYYIVLGISAIFIATNHQLISGWLAQPSNIEQYFGVIIIASVLALAINSAKLANLMILVTLVLVFLRGYQSFKSNFIMVDGLSRSELAAIAGHEDQVVTTNIRRAVVLNLLFPKQPATALSASRAYLTVGQQEFKRYACVRKEILDNPAQAVRYQSTFESLDPVYRYGNNDYILNTINRRGPSIAPIDVTWVPQECPKTELIYIDP